MSLSEEQLGQFEDEGVLMLPDLFSNEEIGVLRKAIKDVIARPGPNVTPEPRTDAVRMVHGAHDYNEVFDAFCRHPRILGPAEQLLDSKVYIHQSRLNLNAGFDTGGFDWHQDYSTWHVLDGLAEPRALMIAVLVEDMTPANGPLLYIPGSHKAGLVEDFVDQADDVGNVLMEISPEILTEVASGRGVHAALGAAGSVLFMHCEILHASSANVSPYPRTLYYINVNSVENPQTTFQREWFHAGQDFTPLETVDDGVLTAAAAAG